MFQYTDASKKAHRHQLHQLVSCRDSSIDGKGRKVKGSRVYIIKGSVCSAGLRMAGPFIKYSFRGIDLL